MPDNIVLLPLPPYAPELNPMENVWEFMRSNFLSHRVWDGTRTYWWLIAPALVVPLSFLVPSEQDAVRLVSVLAVVVVFVWVQLGCGLSIRVTCAATSSVTVSGTYDAIIEACCNAWNKLMQMTERIASLTRRSWAKPVAG